MFIVKLIRSLLGYVVFAATGGFPERFINLCVKDKIPLWDLRNHGDVLEGKTTISGYKRIRRAVHRSGVRMRIREKRGFPFLTAQNRRRVGLLIGVVLAGMLVAYLTTMVWTVRVEGNVQIPEETILAAAKELGVCVGARRSKLDVQAIAETLLVQVDGLSWAAVNLDSSKAVVEVRESVPAPEILDTQTPANIIATEDGILTKVEVYSGTAALPVGSAVVKGDLLISGVVKNADQTETLWGAQGNVYAKVERNMVFTCPDTPFAGFSSADTRYSLFFLGLRIPLGRRLEGESYLVERYCANADTVLPVGILRERTQIYATDFVLEERTDRARYAAKKFAAAYGKLWRESVILSNQVTFDYFSAQPSVTGKLLCEKEIGANQKIFVEKISD